MLRCRVCRHRQLMEIRLKGQLTCSIPVLAATPGATGEGRVYLRLDDRVPLLVMVIRVQTFVLRLGGSDGRH